MKLVTRITSIRHLALAAVAAFSLQANAQTATCTTDLNNWNVKAETCTTENQKVVRITFPRALRQAPVSIEVTYSRNAKTGAFNPAWERVANVSGDGIVTKLDQLAVRKLVVARGPQSFDPSTLGALDFVSNFVEPGMRLENIDTRTSSNRSLLKAIASLGYTSICESVGSYREAYFTAKGESFVAAALVGDESTRCRGRCGTSCAQSFQWRNNQYTQECLNHDICKDINGTNMGPCKDEFLKAAIGYAVAPDCH